MSILLYIYRFLYRIRWWLILGPTLATLLMIWKTRHLTRTYETEMTIYTGIFSGSATELDQSQSLNWNIVNNTLQNIINIITSKETLQKVSIRLYARSMIYGDAKDDNVYITAEHYRQLVAITPKDVLSRIDKSSEDSTIANLQKIMKPDRNNFVYGLFNWYHPHLSYSALQNIKVKRVEGSDILEVSYWNDDPGIVFQTLEILNKVYTDEYRGLQFGSTNNVIKYFETELARVGLDLRGKEDSLTTYNVANRIINYDEQTKLVAALDRDYESRYQDMELSYNSSKTAIKHLEEGIDQNLKLIKSNSEFIARLNRIADLNYSISEMESFRSDSLQFGSVARKARLAELHHDLSQQEKDLKAFTFKYSNQKYTRDGYPTSNFVTQWIDELLKFEKAKTQLEVLNGFKRDIDGQYSRFSPIGSTIKRQERGINFTENTYLSILGSLNSARLRLKSLEMNSATLKVINPPTFPLDAKPTKRKTLVLATFFGSLFFILGVFLILELFDRSLRDKMRAELLTSGKVMGAFPRLQLSGIRNGEESRKTVFGFLAGQIFGYFRTEASCNMINLTCVNESSDAEDLAAGLRVHWEQMGVKVGIFIHGADFDVSSRDFLFARRFSDIAPLGDADVILVIHAPLKEAPVPSALLQEGVLNLLVLRADLRWKGADQIVYDELLRQSKDSPVLLCLSRAERKVVEDFTGMLPS